MENGRNSIRIDNQTPRLLLAKGLETFRNLVGGDRFGNLYSALSYEISAIKPNCGKSNKEEFKILDYGCGNMNFSERLKSDGLITEFVGMDTFPVPQIDGFLEAKWARYRQVPKEGVDESIGKFSVTILVDVLHHMPPSDQPLLLKTLAKLSQYIIVKDHFEYGAVSRQVLRLADWYGNYAYGVNIPKRYFDEGTWTELLAKTCLTEVSLKKNVKVHDGLFNMIVPPRCHFISTLTSDF